MSKLVIRERIGNAKSRRRNFPCVRKDMTSDRRLIEDFIPIREISIEAAREKYIRKGHISTLHLW